jgi:hypothetical protein
MEETEQMLREEIGEGESPEDIYVEYNGPGNPDIDKKLREALQAIGYVETGSGYHIEKKVRDLHFVRKDKV